MDRPILNYQPILWDPDFETGVVIIDSQHKKLFEFYNEILAMCDEEDVHLLDFLIFEGLNYYTKYHFTVEQIILTHLEYYTVRVAHEKEHEGFIRSLVDLSLDTHCLNEDRAREKTYILLEFFRTWLVHHVCTSDTIFKTQDKCGYRPSDRTEYLLVGMLRDCLDLKEVFSRYDLRSRYVTK
jgi:hemerythrin